MHNIDCHNIEDNRFFPNDFFGWILFLFALVSMTLTGYGQVRVIGVILAGSFTLYFLFKKQWVPMEMILFLIWTVWAGLTGYIVSIDKEAFMDTFKVVLQVMIMSFAISGITANRHNIRFIFLGLAIGGIILLLSIFFSGEFLNALDIGAQVQVKGLLDNPNEYGFYLLMSVASLIYFWINSASMKIKVLFITLLPLFITGIILSASRKSFIGLWFLILSWQFIRNRKAIIKKPFLIISLVFVIGATYVVSDYMLSNTYMGVRFERDFGNDATNDSLQNDPASSKRVVLYEEGLEFVKKHMIFGIGLGNFAVMSTLSKESHSDYMEVFASTGLPGFLMYFSIYILLWRRLSWIQKHTNDESIKQNIALFKPIIGTILILATGRPIITSHLTWILLSGFIGYSWSLEKELLHHIKIRKVGRLNLHNG